MESDIERLNIEFTDLLLKSEARIDKTNDMISKCVSIISQVTNEYTKQISKLQESRDFLILQNGELLKLVQKYEDQHELDSQRYDRLLEKTLALSSKSENNITVK